MSREYTFSFMYQTWNLKYRCTETPGRGEQTKLKMKIGKENRQWMEMVLGFKMLHKG